MRALVWLCSDVGQGWATSVLEGHCLTEFSSNPNKTQMNKLISVFKTIRKLQVSFSSDLELNYAGLVLQDWCSLSLM